VEGMEKMENDTKQKAIKLLEYYPEIDEDIRMRKNTVIELESNYNTIGAMIDDGMPKGKNNITRPTENRAINMPDFVHKEIRTHKLQIERLQKLKVEMLKEVSRLSLQQKKIIFSFYIHGKKWDEVSGQTNYSTRQCKNIRDTAIETLGKKFEDNAIITLYSMELGILDKA
jgi:hypothetical protein